MMTFFVAAVASEQETGSGSSIGLRDLFHLDEEALRTSLEDDLWLRPSAALLLHLPVPNRIARPFPS